MQCSYQRSRHHGSQPLTDAVQPFNSSRFRTLSSPLPIQSASPSYDEGHAPSHLFSASAPEEPCLSSVHHPRQHPRDRKPRVVSAAHELPAGLIVLTGSPFLQRDPERGGRIPSCRETIPRSVRCLRALPRVECQQLVLVVLRK